MRIAGNYTAKTSKSTRYFPLVLALIVFAIIIKFAFFSSAGDSSTFFSDMENAFKAEDGAQLFKAKGNPFSNAHTQSDERAFSGKYSSLCDRKNVYGATITLYNVNAGDIIEASVWQQSDQGYGALVFQGEWPGYYNFYRTARKVQNNWEEIYLIDTIPLGVENASLKVYPMISSKEGKVFFDDLTVTHIKRKKGTGWKKTPYDAPELNLTIEDRDLKKLRKKRTEALNRGNLITGSKDLVKAKLKEGEKELDAQVRLKGDLLDHLQGNKWSFRIIPEKGQAWNGMQVFSVHNAASRANLLEWVFHQMLIDEDILI